MKLARGSHVEPLLPVRLAIGFPQPGHQSHPWPEESYRPCGPWYLAQRTGPILKLNGKVIWSLFLSVGVTHGTDGSGIPCRFALGGGSHHGPRGDRPMGRWTGSLV